MKLYGEISKTEALDDGTIKVWGYASSEAVDADGEKITAKAMTAAIPDYMKFGAVREMHGKNAAGTAIEIKVEDDGRTYFGAHIVDSEAVKKVKAGVYKGFSIGGSVTKRDDLNKSVITGLKLVEVSLVDRPANPEAVLTCYKADKTDKTEEKPEDEPEEDDEEKSSGGEPKEKEKEKEKEKPKPAANKDGEEKDGEDSEAEKIAKMAKIAQFEQIQKALIAAGCAADGDAVAHIEKMAARIAELEKQPETPKGSLKAIAKAEDNTAEDVLKGFKPITHQDGTLNEAATLIKAIQAQRL
ncbi:MAG: HK97 family phage prohead protease [Neisseria sp.]|nr:HK97 family phage prohead protease [Neisseria sp.]